MNKEDTILKSDLNLELRENDRNKYAWRFWDYYDMHGKIFYLN